MSIRMRKKTSIHAAPRKQSAVTLTDALQWLEKKGTKKQIKELDRYGIVAKRPFGVSVGETKKYAKQIGTNHALAQKLWATGRYEAQILAAFIDDPAQVAVKQMDAWAADFDNWAIVDTACFHLFDRTPHAWKMVPKWTKAKPEFTKRAAFAMLWSLSVHDKDAPDSKFIQSLELIERGATDERNFVKKAVNMALRAIGKRNRALNAAAIDTAERLAASNEPTQRWVGKNALRELTSAEIRKRIAKS